MKWSELPKEYQELEISKEAKEALGHDFNNDDLLHKFYWSHTMQGQDFWNKCEEAKKIDELPPLPEKEFVLSEKWCVQMKDPITDRNVYFHNPSLIGNHYFLGVMDGYTEITYEQWVRYVKDDEYKENSLRKNDNLEKIKEMRDVVNDKEEKMISERKEEPIQTLYMIYVDGERGSRRKHDYKSACKEAYRLSKETDKKVFILRSEYCFKRKVDINLVPIKKD